MEYAFLAIAIVSEVIATSYLKQTEGFTKLTPSLICAAAYIVCHYTFAKSLNRINLNIGYATWCGVGLIVTSLVSIFAYVRYRIQGSVKNASNISCLTSVHRSSILCIAF
jgi:small multidrug resistance pump